MDDNSTERKSAWVDSRDRALQLFGAWRLFPRMETIVPEALASSIGNPRAACPIVLSYDDVFVWDAHAQYWDTKRVAVFSECRHTFQHCILFQRTVYATTISLFQSSRDLEGIARQQDQDFARICGTNGNEQVVQAFSPPDTVAIGIHLR